MERQITKTESYSFAKIEDQNSQIAFIAISSDLHNENSAKFEAVQSFYTEALMAGCKKLSRGAIHEELGLLGSEITINSASGYINIYLKSTDKNIAPVLEIFKNIFEAPTFDNKEIARIKLLIKNELLEKKENADAVAFEKLTNSLYDKADRRYSYDPDELITRIALITKKDLQEFHKQVMTAFWYSTVGGSAKTIVVANRVISDIKSSYQIVTRSQTHKLAVKPKRQILSNIPSRQNIEFSIGEVLPLSIHDKDYPAFMFGLNVLGNWGGFAGRLMSTVREKEGLTYGIYARTETMDSTEFGFWRIKTFFSPEKAEQGLKSTFREIKLIKEQGISDVEYQRFMNILETNQVLLNDSLIRLVREMHSFHTNDFSLEEIQQYKEKLTQVTKKEVNQALNKYLNTDKLTISAAGPVKKVKFNFLNNL